MQGENDANSIKAGERCAQSSSKDSEGQAAKKRDASAKGIVKLTERLQVQLFHTPGQVAFASCYIKGHWENQRVKGSAFKDWLSAACYHHEGFVPSHNALGEAINTLAGRASYSGPGKPVHTRLAEDNGALYLDLCNESWEVVRITAEGWEVASYAPVNFARAPDMLALPYPLDGGGNFDLLRPLLNLDDDNWKLAVGWLVGALHPRGPFPLL